MTLVARGGCLMVLEVVISELQLEPWTCDPSLWLAPIFEFGFVPMLDFLLVRCRPQFKNTKLTTRTTRTRTTLTAPLTAPLSPPPIPRHSHRPAHRPSHRPSHRATLATLRRTPSSRVRARAEEGPKLNGSRPSSAIGSSPTRSRTRRQIRWRTLSAMTSST